MPARRGWIGTAIALVVVLAGVGLLWRAIGERPERRSGVARDEPVANGERRGEAVVLVDSGRPEIDEFDRLIAPYLRHFGVPYVVVDCATTCNGTAVGAYSLIVIGHRGVIAGMAPAARAALDAAVAGGVGLAAFDGDLWDGVTPRLEGLGQLAAPPEIVTASGVSFIDPAAVRTVALADDAHQQPALATLEAGSAVVTTDGQWSERRGPDARHATVLAGIDEPERAGLPAMRFTVADVAPGDYDVVGEVYSGPPGTDLRYGFGFADEAPDTRHVDVTGGSGGTGQHTEYLLGRVAVGTAGFTMQVHDADALRGTPTMFGWRQVRLVPAAASDRAPQYITGRHPAWARVPTAPFSLPLTRPAATTVLAYAGATPLVLAGGHGVGRMVVWTSTDWMRPEILGPIGGLDDLVWRSLVWPARKPFALQLLPPIVTMRMDDESGPLDWLHTAIDVGFKPWVGVFLSNIDDRESRELAAVVRAGDATVSVHSFDAATFFYFDHMGRRAWPTATMAANWRRATEWHRRYDLPMSTYVVPHFYEIGDNVLPMLTASGVEFLVTHMRPGGAYGMPWLRSGPFRRDARGVSTAAAPVYYADDLPDAAAAGAPGLFNCVTEVRDDAGYEWYPSPDIDVTVGRAVRQLTRALDSRALATLFTHGYFLPPIPAADWRTILERTVAGVAAYSPIQLTMDRACTFVRDQHTSALTAVRVENASGALRLTFSGQAAAATTVSIFTDRDGTVVERAIGVPPFTGAVAVRVDPAAATGQPDDAGLGIR
jgi:hypothetical protein